MELGKILRVKALFNLMMIQSRKQPTRTRALVPCRPLVRLMFNRSSEAASSLAVHCLCALQ